jgi:hypothetical protein
MMYFKQGRAVGKPWLWVSLPKVGHQTSTAMEDFVRGYFAMILKRGNSSGLSQGMWVDVDTKKVMSESEAGASSSLSGRIPDPSLIDDWRKIHAP